MGKKGFLILSLIISSAIIQYYGNRVTGGNETSTHYSLEPNIFLELENLIMVIDGDLWKIKIDENHKELIIIGPDVWQGNSDIFPIEGSVRVGHLWSQFLMLKEGHWLTDKDESEGEHLINFIVHQDQGKVIWYKGSWGFRDYFNTTAEHFVWIKHGYSYHLVNVVMHVLTTLEDIDAIWVELMNDIDPYGKVYCKTSQGIIEGDCQVNSGNHNWGNYTLDEGGWITFLEPLQYQKGVPAFFLLQSSHPVHPIWFDSKNLIENIELHIIPPRESITISEGNVYSLQYMLVTGPVTSDAQWVEQAINNTLPIVELIRDRQLLKHSNISIFSSLKKIEVNSSVRIEGNLIPKIANSTIELIITKPDNTIETVCILSEKDGTYSLEFTPNSLGVWKIASRWNGTNEYYGSLSREIEIITYEIEQRQEPEPEKEPSAWERIPGFPYESIILGIMVGVLLLWCTRKYGYLKISVLP